MLEYLFKSPSIDRERDFEIKNTLAQLDRYLMTNPLTRYREDKEYARKVDIMRDFAASQEGLILDLGCGTGGESTILCNCGHKILACDINHEALAICIQRGHNFGIVSPWVTAADVHVLPFRDESFSAVMVFEALHHFYDYDTVLNNIFRVLKPGGSLFLFEPNGLNPIRRFSEVRTRPKGTIEKSFFPFSLRRLLTERNEFIIKSFDHEPGIVSSWKLETLSFFRRKARLFHGWLSKTCPLVFASLKVIAYKQGDRSLAEVGAYERLEDILISPITGNKLEFIESESVWRDREAGHEFPHYKGVPVLVPTDVRKVKGHAGN
jgi:ubiquinone/menaquinone biosynthesis C-methylase UbiE/uncharacterized protein YbaR (Trm112 family)